MAPSALAQHVVRPRLWVCRQCQRRPPAPRVVVRDITQGHLRKTIEAEWQWKEQARAIQAGRKQSFVAMLEERGFVHDTIGDRKTLDTVMTEKRIAAYCGVDPTAASLHMGHMLPLMVTFWMYLYGFSAITVLGGATAKIGDPSGRTTAREGQNSATRKTNMAQMHIQLKRLWASVERVGRRHGFMREWAWRRALMNNNEWLNRVGVTEFLRIMGPAMRLGPMLSRDTVKLRQQSGDGMSFGEFTYPVLQAYDYWHLFSRNQVQLQIGGQDQYGNILAGISAVNNIRRDLNDPELKERLQVPKHRDYLAAPYGLTVPLLTTSAGKKFGKSAGNAVWLSPELTSSYDLYGYMLKTRDDDVERYLKLFTFLPLPTIAKTMEEHNQDRRKRVAQHLLAKELIDLVHGPASAEAAATQHAALFGKPPPPEEQPSASDSVADEAPQYRPSDPRGFANASSGNKFAPQVTAMDNPPMATYLPKSLVYGNNFPRLLWSAGLVATRSEGFRIVAQQGAYVAGLPGQVGAMGDSLKFTPIKHVIDGVPEKFIFDGNQLLIRIGKWKVKNITIIPDKEFVAKNLKCPGWDHEKGEPEPRKSGDVENATLKN